MLSCEVVLLAPSCYLPSACCSVPHVHDLPSVSMRCGGALILELRASEAKSSKYYYWSSWSTLKLGSRSVIGRGVYEIG